MPSVIKGLLPNHYRVIGDIINKIADPLTRHQMADHFATEFRKRYPDGFDPMMWSKQTGGHIRGYNIRTGRFADNSP